MSVYKLLVAAIAVASSHHGDPLKVKPITVDTGKLTFMELPLIRLVQDQDAWADVWVLHKGPAVVNGIANGDTAPLPEIDFSKNQVLAIFGGQVPGVQGYEYIKTVKDGDKALIQLAPSYFPTPQQVIMKPYIMLVLPKEKVGIEVEMAKTASDGTVGWTRIADFPAPKDSKDK